MLSHTGKMIFILVLFSSVQADTIDMGTIYRYMQDSARDVATLMEDIKLMQIQMASLVDEVQTMKEIANQQQDAIRRIETVVKGGLCDEYDFTGQSDYCQNVTTGVQVITAQYSQPGCGELRELVDVFCDQFPFPGGWLVVLRRVDNAEDFPLRTWKEYKQGFGFLNGSFWLGLELMHQLTLRRPAILRIELEDFDGESRYAEYENFRILSEDDGYKLQIGDYTGNAGDSLTYHNGMKFSTVDRDQDLSSDHCSKEYEGAWWYNGCKKSQLTGYYYQGTQSREYEGIAWYAWRGTKYSYKKAEMKIRWT